MFSALAKFGAPLQQLTPADFAHPGPFFPMSRWALTFSRRYRGTDFDAAWNRRTESVIDLATGLKASFISRDDLIAAKLASGRPHDLGDVDAIRRAEESRRPSATKKKPPAAGPENRPD
jgi:hypothetical protein